MVEKRVEFYEWDFSHLNVSNVKLVIYIISSLKSATNLCLISRRLSQLLGENKKSPFQSHKLFNERALKL